MPSQGTLELGRDFSRVGRPEASAPVYENQVGLAGRLLEPDVHCRTNLLDQLCCPFRHFPRELRVKHFWPPWTLDPCDSGTGTITTSNLNAERYAPTHKGLTQTVMSGA